MNSYYIGIAWACAAGTLFLLQVLRHEWREYKARIHAAVDAAFRHQDNVVPDYKTNKRIFDDAR